MKTRNVTHLYTAAIALSASLILAANGIAADEPVNLNAADTRFIQEEGAAGVAMVKMAELGAQKAQHKDIKAFAGTLVTDHTAANTELATLAASKRVDLNADTSSNRANHAKHKDMHGELERASAAEFDRTFLALVIKGHEACVANFHQASTNAEDRDLQAWAAKTLPGLQAHLKKAKELSSPSTTSTGSAPSNAPANAPASGTANAPANAPTGGTASARTTQPDNTARNKRDRDQKTLTPLNQGNSKSDIDTTAKIRREIVSLDGLSVNAQNVKIITNGGHVTLRGPVGSAAEKRKIGEIATRIATLEHVDNQLEVRSADTGN